MKTFGSPAPAYRKATEAIVTSPGLAEPSCAPGVALTRLLWASTSSSRRLVFTWSPGFPESSMARRPHIPTCDLT